MPKIGPKYVFLKVSETVRFGRMSPTQKFFNGYYDSSTYLPTQMRGHVCHTDHIYRSEGVKVTKSEQN